MQTVSKGGSEIGIAYSTTLLLGKISQKNKWREERTKDKARK